MKCPYCDMEDHRRKVHIHLVEDHADMIFTDLEKDQPRMFYRIDCPQCTVKLEKTVKPRWKDPGFLQEFEKEIKLVAFDMLLNHIEGIHSASGPV